IFSMKCPQDWTYFNGKCYAFFDKLLHYESAIKFCNDNKADMVLIKSDEERQFLFNLVKDESDAAKKDGIWLSAVREKLQSKFVTAEGKEITYTFWRDGEPNVSNEKRTCIGFTKVDSLDKTIGLTTLIYQTIASCAISTIVILLFKLKYANDKNNAITKEMDETKSSPLELPISIAHEEQQKMSTELERLKKIVEHLENRSVVALSAAVDGSCTELVKRINQLEKIVLCEECKSNLYHIFRKCGHRVCSECYDDISYCLVCDQVGNK
ncbi:C-type lectin mannose-binding isoform-like protein, partial [Leptotrombidium deliense]